jgi:hypothetical protein
VQHAYAGGAGGVGGRLPVGAHLGQKTFTGGRRFVDGGVATTLDVVAMLGDRGAPQRGRCAPS